MNGEVWKDIPGFEGYQISNTGRLRSCRVKGKSTITGSTYALSDIWKDVKITTRGDKKYPRPFAVIRKFGLRKSYTFQISRLVWELFVGPIPEKMQVDHINLNAFDNRVENLRLATHQQNSFNRDSNKVASSKFKGVCWVTKTKRWHAQIKIDQKTTHLGNFVNEIDAAKAYNEAAKKLFNNFAFLNELPEEVH